MVAVSGGSATLPHMFIRTKHDPERKRTRIQIVQSVRTGQKVRQKVVRHVGIAHNDTEVADLKRLAGRIMEELRASQSPQMELFTPTEYADLATLVRTAPRPEKLNVDLGECREESRLSLPEFVGFVGLSGVFLFNFRPWLPGGQSSAPNAIDGCGFWRFCYTPAHVHPHQT